MIDDFCKRGSHKGNDYFLKSEEASSITVDNLTIALFCEFAFMNVYIGKDVFVNPIAIIT